MAPAAAWLPALISGGAAVGGAAISARGQSTAADKQAEAIQKGIDLQEKMYHQDRADLAPYRELGGGAVGNLAYGMGIPKPAPASTPPVLPQSTVKGLTFPGAPQVPAGTLSTLQTLGSPGSSMNKLGQHMLGKVATAQQMVNDKFGGPGATVKVKAPNGFIYLMPPDQVAAATAKGGMVV